MGQAKRRGTLEERIAQSVERTAREELEARVREQARWDALSPQEQARELRGRQRAALIVGMSMIMAARIPRWMR